VTLGQYLRPTPKHVAVERFVPPEQFDAFAREGKAMGFSFVASGPLVRSSYKAAEVFLASTLGTQAPAPTFDRTEPLIPVSALLRR